MEKFALISAVWDKFIENRICCSKFETFKMHTNERGKQFYLNIISMRCDPNDTM